MNIAEIEKFLTENGEDSEVRKFTQRLTDRAVSKAIESHDKKFREEKLGGLVDAEVQKRSQLSAEETFKQKELEFQLREKALRFSLESGIDPELSLKFLGRDEAETEAGLNTLAGKIGEIKSQIFNELTSKTSKPIFSRDGGEIEKIDLKRMSPSQINEAFKKGLLGHLFSGGKR